MSEDRLFEYRTIEVERGGWPEAIEAIAARGRALEAEGGRLFAVFVPQIGASSETGLVMTTWPDAETYAKHAETGAGGIVGVRTSGVERLGLAASPRDPEPPEQPGVYAHRWFEVERGDRDEFVELSRAAWPDFESSHEVRIVGLFDAHDGDGTRTRLLLVTRYASLAVWERSRTARTEREREAWQRFRRRGELTRQTIVRTWLLARPGRPIVPTSGSSQL